MRVVLIDFEFFAYTISLANALSALCEVFLLLPNRAAERYQVRVSERLRLRGFHMPRLRYPSNVLMVYSLFKTIYQIHPDVVHQLSWHPWFNIALPLFPDVRLVTTIHDAKQHPGDKESPPLFVRQQWQRADRVIVHAESIREQILAMEPALDDRLHVIPHGMYDFYKTWAREETALEEIPTVLFFGRIWPYKGLQHLIEAEPIITRQIPDVRIVIAGQGEPFEKYERMIVNRDHFVVYNQYIPDEMVASLFQQASIVALPYTEASQSGILALAYAFGKPVVASAVGGIPEVVVHGETGYLVPPCDAEALAEAVVRLLRHHTIRKRMGLKALEKAETELSWPNVALQTLEVYRLATEVPV